MGDNIAFESCSALIVIAELVVKDDLEEQETEVDAVEEEKVEDEIEAGAL